MTSASAANLTHKRILYIAVPVVLSNATVPILGAVDTAVVGQLGQAVPIGAVGIGAIIITSIFWLFGFLRMGTSGLTAQAIGAGDDTETSALLVRSMAIGFGAGLVFVLIQAPVFWAVFQLAPASPEVEALAGDYLRIRIYSGPATIALYGITGWLIAAERTRSVLVIQLVMNSMNIALDILFVLHFEWGVAGVAYASLIAEWSGFGLGLWLARQGISNGAWKNWGQIFDRARLRQMAVVNSDILIRTLLLEAGFLSFMFLGSSFDDATLAANQVLLQFLYITSYAMDGFAISAETLVGQAMGARNRQALRRSVVLTFQWGAVTAIVMALLFAIFGGRIIDLMTTASDVRDVAGQYLPWMILAPILGGASWMFDGIFIGATRTADMRNMMLVSFGIYLLALAALLPSLENHGLWASLIIFFVARGVTLGWRYPKLEAAVR
jgi:MATE family multidrug resistance protein